MRERKRKKRVKKPSYFPLHFRFSIVIFIVTLSEHVTSRSRYDEDDWEKKRKKETKLSHLPFISKEKFKL